MGCDIHIFAEVKKKNLIESLMFWKKKQWKNIDVWTKNKYFDPEDPDGEREFEISRENSLYSYGRNYNLFCALCGVRRSHFQGSPKFVSEPKGIPTDASKEVLNEIKIYGSDGHSHSWNTLKELKEFDWSDYGQTVNTFLEEVIPKMKAQKVKDTDVRIVYFFDN